MIKALQLRLFILFALFSFFGIAQKADLELAKSLLSNKFSNSTFNWKIDKQHTSSISGINHISYSQQVNGISVIGTDSKLHINKQGKTILENNRFLKGEALRSVPDNNATLSSGEALRKALDYLDMDATEEFQIVIPPADSESAKLISRKNISEEKRVATLKYLMNEKDELQLVWELSILEEDESHFWLIRLDAATGEFIEKYNQVYSCSYEAETISEENFNTNLYDIPNYKKPELNASSFSCTNCYEVFEFPKESPYFGERTIVESPSYPLASPYGWHDTNGYPGAEALTTEGNNVMAFEAGDNYGYNPNATDDLNFTGYTFDPVFMESSQSEAASLTNIFYWMNLFHDISYVYGFTEEAGNLQQNNYGNGSPAFQNDPLIVQIQSPLTTCNAEYLNFPDGISSKIRMYLCNTKDSSFDSTIVLHEYAHAISIRLESINGVTCGGNEENPNEGWSDWFAMMLTMKATDTAEQPRGIGTYMVSQGADGVGLREYPYSTDMAINPNTYGSLQSEMSRHKVGAIWASILWEVSWGLIENHGFDPNLYNFTGDVNQDAGNIMALAIMTEALKLTPCVPNFVDTRDAIIVAASNIYGSGLACEMWDYFALRGLGFDANPGSTAIVGDETESFSNEAGSGIFDLELPPVCETGGTILNLGGGYPIGGTYDGAGVSDNGNGRSFVFDPLEAGIGEHILTYTLLETECYSGSATTTVVTVVEDAIPPIVQCNLAIVERLHPSLDLYEVPDFSFNVYIEDECSNNLTIIQDPPVGTMIEGGLIEVSFYAEDPNGNSASCSFELEIERKFQEDPNLPDYLNEDLIILPNPSNGYMVLSNPYGYRINHWEVRDLTGRFVYGEPVNNGNTEVPIRLENLAAGMYFVKIDYKRTSRTYRIVIE